MKRLHRPTVTEAEKKVVWNITVYEHADMHAHDINGIIKYEIVILLLRVNNDGKIVI